MSSSTLAPTPSAPLEDAAAVDAFADRVMTAALGWYELMSIHVGSQLGWYAHIAETGSASAAELAAATATNARYAREWLEQQAAVGILCVDATVPVDGDDPDARRFTLAPGAATVLLDRGSLSYLEPLARFAAASAAQIEPLLAAYRSGDGVSWEQLGKHAREAQAEMNRPWFEGMPQLIADIPHLDEILRTPGARVADIGCGGGWSSIALAQHYPRLQVVGFEVDEESVTLARANAESAGLADRVSFVLDDAAHLPGYGVFDAAFAFECIHDMPQPVPVLAAARAAVREGGAVVIMDEATEEQFTPDAGEVERLLYGLSLFVCLPDGMSHQPSVGTGTVMRPATLRGYAREAGWADIRVLIPEFGLWRFYELV